NSLPNPAAARCAKAGGAQPAHQQHQRLPQPSQGMAASFSWCRHEVSRPLPRMAADCRSAWGRRPTGEMAAQRSRDWAISIITAKRAIFFERDPGVIARLLSAIRLHGPKAGETAG